jgi:hypothetical protein
MERHEAGEARVIPVILRPVDNWHEAPFGKLQPFPTNGKPVTTWDNQDEAFANVAQAIRKAVKEIAGTAPMAKPAPASQNTKPATKLTRSERRRLEQERDELQQQYDLLSEEIRFLRKSERTDDLSPREKFRLTKQIEESQTERGKVSDRLEAIEHQIEQG